MSQVTRTVAGHKITLTKGVRYIATRPAMAYLGQKEFPITISPSFVDEPALIIPGLNYRQANEFINEFNNGSISLTGRVW